MGSKKLSKSTDFDRGGAIILSEKKECKLQWRLGNTDLAVGSGNTPSVFQPLRRHPDCAFSSVSSVPHATARIFPGLSHDLLQFGKLFNEGLIIHRLTVRPLLGAMKLSWKFQEACSMGGTNAYLNLKGKDHTNDTEAARGISQLKMAQDDVKLLSSKKTSHKI